MPYGMSKVGLRVKTGLLTRDSDEKEVIRLFCSVCFYLFQFI